MHHIGKVGMESVPVALLGSSKLLINMSISANPKIEHRWTSSMRSRETEVAAGRINRS